MGSQETSLYSSVLTLHLVLIQLDGLPVLTKGYKISVTPHSHILLYVIEEPVNQVLECYEDSAIQCQGPNIYHHAITSNRLLEGCGGAEIGVQ
jgi:hypothetical protein